MVNSFALQIEETPLYIIYSKVSETKSKIIIKDVQLETDLNKVLHLEIDDSITHLLFLLSLIRDEYYTKTLFTNKSQLHEQ